MRKIFTLVLVLSLVWICAVVTATQTPLPTPTEIQYVINQTSEAAIDVVGGATNIKIHPIKSDGSENGEVDIKALPTDKKTVASVEAENTAVLTRVKKQLQIHPEAKVKISADGKKIKQSKSDGRPRVELYYGYETSISQPWTEYMRVDSCDAITCKIVKANFSERRVWIEYATKTSIDSVADSDEIPEFVELP